MVAIEESKTNYVRSLMEYSR